MEIASEKSDDRPMLALPSSSGTIFVLAILLHIPPLKLLQLLDDGLLLVPFRADNRGTLFPHDFRQHVAVLLVP